MRISDWSSDVCSSDLAAGWGCLQESGCGRECPRSPADQCERLFIGESALRVWREFRGLEITDLRRDTGIAVERLDQIEAGKSRKMSEVEERALARSLVIGRASLRPMIRSEAPTSELQSLQRLSYDVV